LAAFVEESAGGVEGGGIDGGEGGGEGEVEGESVEHEWGW